MNNFFNMTPKKYKFNKFKLPIQFDKKVKSIEKATIDELDIIDGEDPIYPTIFEMNTEYQKLNLESIAKYYTTNKKYIKQTSKLLKSSFSKTPESSEIMELMKDVETETGFIDKYNYVDWDSLKFLNNNSKFLQALSLYELSSPVLSLALPVILLIVPFFIIRLQGYSMNFTTYYDVLKKVLKNHSIGQIFSFNEASLDKRIFMIISLLFYFVQVYYNFQSCKKFIHNFKLIHQKITIVEKYLTETKSVILNTIKKLENYSEYSAFKQDLDLTLENIERLLKRYSKITQCSYKIHKVSEIGHIMKCFYEIYNEDWVIETINYSMHLNSYIDTMNHIHSLYKSNKINKCNISKNKISMKNAYYPTYIDRDPIKNNIKVDKNVIITGPNASGKTTLIKTTFINLLFSQQFGVGFYEKANIQVFDNFKCYINIPDTSGRDSLFQAEARRCKNIIDNIVNNNTKSFCIFDELFSGTNPYEAIGAATGFLDYLNTHKNITYMITTHFLDLCKNMDDDNQCKNICMGVNANNSKIEYTYKINDGISNVKGALHVLKELNYPQIIIDRAESILDNLSL